MDDKALGDTSLEIYQHVWLQTSDAFVVSDADGIVLVANPAYFELYGYTEEEVIGKGFAIIFPEEMRVQAVEHYKAVFASEAPLATFESTVVRADGTTRIVESTATFLNSAGKRTAMLSTIRDITQRKVVEAALRDSEERMRVLLESVHDYAIYTLDVAGTVTSWNEGARRLKGYTAEEIIGQPFHRFYTPEDIAAGKPEQEMQTALAAGRAEEESWRVRKDGSLFWGLEIMTQLHAADSTHLGFTKVTQDLTLRKLAEDQLRHLNETLERQVVERTEQVRQLVTQLTLSEQEERRRISSILHDDLQQRLFSLAFQLGIMRDQLDKREVTEALQLLTEFSIDLSDSIAMARNLSVALSPPVLHNEGITEALRWLATQMEQQFQLEVTVTQEGTWPRLSPSMRVLLFTVVRELLFNIVKHAGVTTAAVALAREDVWLRIVVSDQGDGFGVNALASESSQGLARVRERLQLFGGRVQVKSSPGQGTRVTIHVPLPAT